MSPRKKTGPAVPAGCVVYLRCSTREQADSGIGLEAQEQRCREHAARLGVRVLGVHSDPGLSGTDALEDREGLQGAIAAIQGAPGSVLVAYSVSRVARRQKVLWGILDDRDGLGIPLSSATESFDTSTPTGKAMVGMLAVGATLEADMCSERTKDGLAAVRARGVTLGAPSMVESVVDGVRALDPVKLATVRMVQSMRAEGLSFRALADKLNADGVPSVTGAKWHPRTVRIACSFRLTPAE